MREKDAVRDLIASLEEEVRKAKVKRITLLSVLIFLGGLAPLDLPMTYLGLTLFTVLLLSVHSHLQDIEAILAYAKDIKKREKI